MRCNRTVTNPQRTETPVLLLWFMPLRKSLMHDMVKADKYPRGCVAEVSTLVPSALGVNLPHPTNFLEFISHLLLGQPTNFVRVLGPTFHFRNTHINCLLTVLIYLTQKFSKTIHTSQVIVIFICCLNRVMSGGP